MSEKNDPKQATEFITMKIEEWKDWLRERDIGWERARNAEISLELVQYKLKTMYLRFVILVAVVVIVEIYRLL